MVRQTYRGEEIWTFPGGSIEANETPIEAAIREVYEETNLNIEIVGLLVKFFNERINGIYYCFLARKVEGTLTLGNDPELNNEEQELKEVRWISIEEVKDNAEVKRILPLIKKYITR
jgi:8-oxo-dGTP diphosphatase